MRPRLQLAVTADTATASLAACQAHDASATAALETRSFPLSTAACTLILPPHSAAEIKSQQSEKSWRQLSWSQRGEVDVNRAASSAARPELQVAQPHALSTSSHLCSLPCAMICCKMSSACGQSSLLSSRRSLARSKPFASCVCVTSPASRTHRSVSFCDESIQRYVCSAGVQHDGQLFKQGCKAVTI